MDGDKSVPRICEFRGIIIEMFHNDHGPPHFHAKHGEHKAVIAIDPIRVLASRLPRREERLVIEWASRRQSELIDNWHRARALEPTSRIAPLD